MATISEETRYNLTIDGATWTDCVNAVTAVNEEYATAPGFSNAPENWKELAKAALIRAGMDSFDAAHTVYNGVILSSTSTRYPAYRELSHMGDFRPYIDDPNGGKWWIITRENFNCAIFESGGSNSSITINNNGDGTYAITGRFDYGYEGAYSAPIYLLKQSISNHVEIDALRQERNDRFVDLTRGLFDGPHSVVDLPDFQEFYDGRVATDDEIRTVTAAAEALGLETYEWSSDIFTGNKIKLLAVKPASGWDSDIVDKLVKLGYRGEFHSGTSVLPLG